MGIEEKLPAGIALTTVENLAGYMRKASIWPATFGLACCAIEMMAVGTPHYDLARFGMERFAATPRQADLMIVAGRVSNKMAPVVRQVYDQMPEPKWVISMGACASSGGIFNNYAVVQGPTRVDVFRSDLVRTVEYGKPDVPVNPGVQPRSGCTIGSALPAGASVRTATRRKAERARGFAASSSSSAPIEASFSAAVR